MTDRELAEREYHAIELETVRAPIGSRDWLIFWQGWQAAKNCKPVQNNVRDAGPTPFAGRNAGVNRG